MGIAVAVFGLLASPAAAERKQLPGVHSSDEIKTMCAASNGVYAEDVTGYGCTTDCQGTGNNNIDEDHCTVSCYEGNCIGWTPSKMAPATSIQQVLKPTNKKSTGMNLSRRRGSVGRRRFYSPRIIHRAAGAAGTKRIPARR
jgi:hypothetical protein